MERTQAGLALVRVVASQCLSWETGVFWEHVMELQVVQAYGL